MIHLLLIASLTLIGCRRSTPAVTPTAAPVRVRMTFVPQNDSFASAAREYERLWAADGPRIVEAMERISGLTFVSSVYADTNITANVPAEFATPSQTKSSPALA